LPGRQTPPTPRIFSPRSLTCTLASLTKKKEKKKKKKKKKKKVETALGDTAANRVQNSVETDELEAAMERFEAAAEEEMICYNE